MNRTVLQEMVNKLETAFPDDTLKEEDIISFDQISRVLCIPIGLNLTDPVMSRVTTKWRKNIEERTQSKILGSARGTGFVALTDPQKIKLAELRLKESNGKAKRADNILDITNKNNLNEKDTKKWGAAKIRAEYILKQGPSAKINPGGAKYDRDSWNQNDWKKCNFGANV